MSRYDNQTIKKDQNGTQYLNTIEYPEVPLRDDDLFIQGMYGQRLDNLAHKYYGNTELWWIIDRAMTNEHIRIITHSQKNSKSYF